MTTEAKTIYEKLIEHLVKMEEEKNSIIEEYYYDMPSERIEFEIFIENYISYIEDHLKKIKKSKKTYTECPFVTIDSIVEVEDINSGEKEKFKIVSPFSVVNLLDGNYASYISPIGKSLLLKKVGDHVLVETPVENIEYEIKSIELS